MACNFKYGHASKWDRQQMEKKLEAEESKKINDMRNTVDALQESAREFERQLAEAAVKAQEAAERKLAELNNGEWIWVEGYKGTNEDMTCRDYQFEINKQFDMPEGSDIEDCRSGFHFCRDLKDVFQYYKIGDGRRFFKVHALVRKKDYEEYGKPVTKKIYVASQYWMYGTMDIPSKITEIRDKLTSKSIVFLRELTPEEVFAEYTGDDASDFTVEEKSLAMKESIYHVNNIRKAKALIPLGYSEEFAKLIVKAGKYEAAYAVGTQEGLSMDMKVAFILREDY